MLKQFGAFTIFATIFAAIVNLAFWLGLIYGAFKIAQHFGVI